MYTERLLRWRWGVLLAWCSVVIVALAVFAFRYGEDHTWIDNSVGVWFQGDDPELLRYTDHNIAFGEREWTLILLEARTSILEPKFLRDLADITRRVQALDDVVKVTSLTNVRDNLLGGDGEIDYARLYAPASGERATAAEVAVLRDRLYANPLFERNLLRADSDKFCVVLVQNTNLLQEPAPYRIRLVDGMTEIISDYASVSSYAIAGTTVVNAELNRAARHDVMIFYLLISLFLVLFTVLVFGNWRDLVALLAVVVGTVLPTMALIAYAGIPYNMITVMLPTILVALGVAGVVHVINSFHQLRSDHPAEEAMRKTLRRVVRPGLYAACTTVAGFSSLTLSSVAPVFQLGLFAALGISLAWILAVSVVPVLLVMLWRKKRRAARERRQLPFTSKFTESPWTRSVGALVFTLPLTGLPMLQTDTNYSEFFADDMTLSRAYEKIDQAGFAQNPLTIGLEYTAGTTFTTIKNFTAVLAFEQAVAKLPQVIKVLSPNGLLGELDRAFNGNAPDSRLSSYSETQINQLLFLGELSDNDDIDDLLLRDRSKAQLIVLTPYLSSSELGRFRQKIATLAATYLPSQVQVYVTGTTALWANMDQQVSATQLWSLLGMALFLTVFLLLIFRSVRLAALALLINGLPLAVVLGAMGWLDLHINIATALIGGITLGIVVDDTLHLLQRFRDNLDLGWDEAIRIAVGEVGPSVVYTTIIIVGGFACLAASSFLPSAQFGALVSLAVVLALLLDLWLLPALLRRLSPRTTTTDNAAPAIESLELR